MGDLDIGCSLACVADKINNGQMSTATGSLSRAHACAQMSKTYPLHCCCQAGSGSCCSRCSCGPLSADWRSAWSYLTRSGSIACRRCASDGAQPADESAPSVEANGSAATGDARRADESDTWDAPTVEAVVVVVVAARSAAVAEVAEGGEDDDETVGRSDAERGEVSIATRNASSETTVTYARLIDSHCKQVQRARDVLDNVQDILTDLA